MALLQKLLSDRNEVMVLHQSSVYCSCGAEFEDFTDAENHLVKHPRVEIKAKNAEKSRIIFKFLSELVGQFEASDISSTNVPAKVDQSLLKSVELPDKVCCLTLEEEDLQAGQLREAVCCECAQQLDSFGSLKNHFLLKHVHLWEPRQNEGSKTILRKLPAKKDFLPGIFFTLKNIKGYYRWKDNLRFIPKESI